MKFSYAFRAWVILLLSVTATASGQTVAQKWNEALLDAIRIDFPAPTVHSRNLYHTSAAMYDAWAAFDPVAGGHFYTQKHELDGRDRNALRDEAVSYAAYRVLSQRYTHAVDPAGSQQIFDGLMSDLSYDTAVTTTEGSSPAAIGNRIAEQILTTAINDGANEANGYVDTANYVPVNVPMVVEYPGVVTPDVPIIAFPNRWQPLFLNEAVTQNDLQGEALQTYIGPHWGEVTTFAMGRESNDSPSWSSLDPGWPPELGGVGDAEYRNDTVLLVEYSNSLDPAKGPGTELINISPSVSGNRVLGTHDDAGYSANPVTGEAYADNFVKRADYGRILAEYWADGPDSETPPGHWNVIANQVSSHPSVRKRVSGSGNAVSDLEWDVKLYLALNGATHDAAVAAWGTKAKYDYVRPITKIRYQGRLGQSSDESLPSYHADGLPLSDGLIELITTESIAEGGKHRNAYINANRDSAGEFKPVFTEEEMVDRIVIHSWNHEPEDTENQVSGTDWILAENWVPFQNDNFVTPAFAAYVSGHSTFSRAAAEVLTQFTGSEYFPDGLGEKTFDEDFLNFEDGPTEPVTLQWASYYDAADEAGISRLWGGIHVPVDDFAGRRMGAEIGVDAFNAAEELFIREDLGWCNIVFTRDINNDGQLNPADLQLLVDVLNTGAFTDSMGRTQPPAAMPPAFYDVTNDGVIAPRDALAVVRALQAVDSQVPTAAAVPEPSSQCLLIWAFGIVMISMRSRRASVKG